MRPLLAIVALALLMAAGCSTEIPTYTGPEVTRVVVSKADRQLYLLHGTEVLERYDIELGFAPEGHKQVEGDGRTPEGSYIIDRRNPNSAYYLSIGISYPNTEDRAAAADLGQSPGGDIFIHGTPREWRRQEDWTAGCIAISNRDMRDVYSMVRDGTQIDILP
ncbi:L,D-transpeptidase family protein [Nioella nitratireducens]|uniref:L,D-transpeptidase family protein n=1 Tax=Nioella nitratireducens TaxID=1287720 RepID=UPI0008FD3520|nr:L,D-transpeptidase family protein [Nioella nitratireducens]